MKVNPLDPTPLYNARINSAKSIQTKAKSNQWIINKSLETLMNMPVLSEEQEFALFQVMRFLKLVRENNDNIVNEFKNENS